MDESCPAFEKKQHYLGFVNFTLKYGNQSPGVLPTIFASYEY